MGVDLAVLSVAVLKAYQDWGDSRKLGSLCLTKLPWLDQFP